MAAALCGHVRCYGLTACQVGKPPPMERMPEGRERVAVRSAFRDHALATMDADPQWSLVMARLATLDATR